MNETSKGIPSPVVEVHGRPFTSSLPAGVLNRIQAGVMRTVYREVPFFKSPFDIALYLQLLSKLRPRTVIEIGTKAGGSALWFADMLRAAGADEGCVVSIDISPAPAIQDPRIVFLTGDAKDLGAVLSEERLGRCPRPWLVVEDSSHLYPDVAAVLAFFHGRLRSGDYIVVEDGVVSQLTAARYTTYQDGPNRAVAEFLEAHRGAYSIDATLCDQYGPNVTYNPNGWIRRA